MATGRRSFWIPFVVYSEVFYVNTTKVIFNSGVGKTSALVTLTKHDHPNYTANIMVDGRGIFLGILLMQKHS